MDFTRLNRFRPKCEIVHINLNELYPRNIMLYREPPREEIKIREFEEFALERLKILKIFDQANSNNFKCLSNEWKDYITTELTRERLNDYLSLCKDGGYTGIKTDVELQTRRRDYMSHFILRLVYCRSNEMSRWLISREMEFFYFKLSSVSSNDIKKLLAFNRISYTTAVESENELIQRLSGEHVSTQFYKFRFEEVLSLINERNCLLHKGYAYLPVDDLKIVLGEKQQFEIEYGLQVSQKLISEIHSDDRLHILLQNLSTSDDCIVNKNSGVPIDKLDQLSIKSFPLCMRTMHQHLRQRHHLKYEGRLQYCLFLKGIGVTLENSLRFWHDEFTKAMDETTYAKKNYSYNIRHNYGKEGVRIDWKPHSCTKIIETHPRSAEIHGCPFKYYDQFELKQYLSFDCCLTRTEIEEVMNFVIKKDYESACSLLFEISHDVKLDNQFTHPNEYFDKSQVLLRKKAEKVSNVTLMNDTVFGDEFSQLRLV